MKILLLFLLSSFSLFAQNVTNLTLAQFVWAGFQVTTVPSETLPPGGNGLLTNNSLITINDNAAATPYPSSIILSNYPVGAVITNVKCGLSGFEHGYPSDVIIILQNPSNATVELDCERGGAVAVTGLDFLFDDAAAGPLSFSGPLTSGTWQPLNGSDSLPVPGPSSPYGNWMTNVFGISPNGEWKLWAADLSSGDSGAITNGWYLMFGISTNL